MRSKTITVILVLVVIAAAAVFSLTSVHALWYAPEAGPSAPTSTAEAVATADAAPSALPSRLIIPSLNINAHIQDLGINAAGNMQAPDNFTDVGWYKYGTVPGEIGSAVIDGHVDNGLALDGVFKHLTDIKVGDEVDIETNGGKTLHFVVSDIETYQYQGVPTQTLFNRKDAARLNLITCEGTWVPGGDTYDHRIVIYTKLVGNS
jgi:sortase A